jgi:hypothetical protein
MSRWLLAIFAGLYAPLAAAQGYSIDGVRFTAASDNLMLTGVGGAGTLEEPFIVAEEITGDGDAVLRIEVDGPAFGNRVHTLHAVGFALSKQVTNRTDRPWTFFTMELEFTVGEGSDYYDGLSFAQAATVNRPFRSTSFEQVDDLSEPRDMLRFSRGIVEPGQTAVFRFAITQTGRQPGFYLVQKVRSPVASLEPVIELANYDAAEWRAMRSR